ncbi:hypothetical protein EJB05_43297 [Eragrostis curvula]|uniref:Remorin C-terminal domain-containing protein n=1 Tax=Eragrostis curvula TaxID=38414 RepID=A0A5J9TGN1_9POAL|nr:hypothetical protein EJB05_43297 [Eragrostis curvula]
MRGGGVDFGPGFRGVMGEEEEEVVSAPERTMRRRRRRRRRRRGEEADDGYSPSSTGGGGSSCCGSFDCDSLNLSGYDDGWLQPLAGFVRPDGDPDTDLETDGLATSSSNVYTERPDEEVLCGVKEEEWARVQEPAKNPAGLATPECQNHRYRPETARLLGRKGSKQRPASLDFGSPGFNGASFSPSFVVGGVGLMNKGFLSSRIRSDVFHSPGTPNYPRHRTSVLGCQKGWSSERVPLPSKGNRRYPGSSMAFPYSNGRTLPSKWEDAERWIFSPNSSDALGRTSAAHARRPKSKSGPLGPPGRLGGQYSSVSSSLTLLDSGRVGPFTANSPFVAGVLIPEHVCGGKSTNGTYPSRVAADEISVGSGGRFRPANCGSNAIRSTRVRRRLDIAAESSASLPSTQESIRDQQVDTTEDSGTTVGPIISTKDAATQTSPELSRSSSPNTRPPFTRSLSTQQVKESEACFSDIEIRDVQMDDRVTLTRWSKKVVTRSSNKNSMNIIDWKEKTVESKSSSWDFTEAKCISKVEIEDANVTAWDNLQKAKAEAAIQKLVMKLEKKRSSSLDKIFNTLRSAQRKTQVMRDCDAATISQDEKVSRKTKKTSQLSKNGQIRIRTRGIHSYVNINSLVKL